MYAGIVRRLDKCLAQAGFVTKCIDEVSGLNQEIIRLTSALSKAASENSALHRKVKQYRRMISELQAGKTVVTVPRHARYEGTALRSATERDFEQYDRDHQIFDEVSAKCHFAAGSARAQGL